MTKVNLFPNRTVVFSGDLFEFAKFEDNFIHGAVFQMKRDMMLGTPEFLKCLEELYARLGLEEMPDVLAKVC